MNNFTFYNPVRIHFGAGQIEKISEEIPKDAKVLMVYGGGSIKKNGIYDQVVNVLEDFDLTEFGGVTANPEYDTLMEAVQLIREKGLNYILAVGGGSVIDGVKFIAAAVNYTEGEPWEILSKRKKFENPLPFGAVLTLPATGSEMNSGGVISRKSIKEKLAFGHPSLFPKFSIMDPQVVGSLPERQLRNGVVDAFVHVIEQYLTYNTDADVQERWSESLLISLKESGKDILQNPQEYQKAANLMWAATMALNGIIRVGCPEDWSTHMIGHELTALHGLDHGLTLAIVLPGVMQEMREEKYEKLLQYGERVWGIVDGDEEVRIDRVIEKTDNFFRELGMQTRLSEHGIGEDTIDEIVSRFSNRPGFDSLSERRNLTPERVGRLLRARL